MESPVAQSKLRPHTGNREGCWSECATVTLIEAWGDRYLKLNRGNLRQKDWKKVADAVNSRQNGVKPQRTDIQCKNRVDTLKNKYKLKKPKSSPSIWPFYDRLDYLGGTSGVTPPPSSFNKKPTTITLTVKPGYSPNTKPTALVYSGGSPMPNSSSSNNSSLGGGAAAGGDDDLLFTGPGRKRKLDYVDLSEGIS